MTYAINLNGVEIVTRESFRAAYSFATKGIKDWMNDDDKLYSVDTKFGIAIHVVTCDGEMTDSFATISLITRTGGTQ